MYVSFVLSHLVALWLLYVSGDVRREEARTIDIVFYLEHHKAIEVTERGVTFNMYINHMYSRQNERASCRNMHIVENVQTDDPDTKNKQRYLCHGGKPYHVLVYF